MISVILLSLKCHIFVIILKIPKKIKSAFLAPDNRNSPSESSVITYSDWLGNLKLFYKAVLFCDKFVSSSASLKFCLEDFSDSVTRDLGNLQTKREPKPMRL